MENITIIGDSLSMVYAKYGLSYKNTYPYLLQTLLDPCKYHVISRSRRRNHVLTQSLRDNLDDDILYNDSQYIIIHLGIVDCAPRTFSLLEDRILYVLMQAPVLKWLANFVTKFKSKHRRFFTKNFPQVYVTKPDFKEKYELILNEIKSKVHPKKVFLLNIADTNDENKRRSYNFEKNILEYNEVIADLARKNAGFCELIDVFGLTKSKKEFLLDDGIHLGKEAHEALAKILYEKIKE
jgi:lysophospholipase L1-like esterase